MLYEDYIIKEEVASLESSLTSLSLAFDKVMHVHASLDFITTEGYGDALLPMLLANGLPEEYITTESTLVERIKSSISTFIQKFLTLLSKWKNKVFSGNITKIQGQLKKFKDSLKAGGGDEAISANIYGYVDNRDKVKKALKDLGIEHKGSEVDDSKIKIVASLVETAIEKYGSTKASELIDTMYDKVQGEVKALSNTITDDNKVEVQKQIKEKLTELRANMATGGIHIEAIKTVMSSLSAKGKEAMQQNAEKDAKRKSNDDTAKGIAQEQLDKAEKDNFKRAESLKKSDTYMDMSTRTLYKVSKDIVTLWEDYDEEPDSPGEGWDFVKYVSKEKDGYIYLVIYKLSM